MLQFLIIFGCLVAFLVTLISLAIFVLVSLNNPEMISEARQGWIARRSDRDEQGW